MRITSLRIENFRSIKALDVELGPTTVFIGPNNAGKTAILDAIRIALTRRWGQRGTGFTEYDVHLAKEGEDPKTSPGVVIELRAEENFQVLRRTQASLGHKAGVDPKVAADQRGHAIGVAINTYTDSDLESRREVVTKLERALAEPNEIERQKAGEPSFRGKGR